MRQARIKMLPKIPRPLSLVKFIFPAAYKGHESTYLDMMNKTLIFLGEIPNMPQHCVILMGKFGTSDCVIKYGYHTCDFVELTEEET